jgi:S1-C subfamily serine protease
MLNELLDNYANGQLTASELEALEERMRQNSDLRKKVEQHAELIEALRFYNERKTLLKTLNEVHTEVEGERNVVPIQSAGTRRFKKYWPISAVAASVALVSILGTLYLTRSLETKQTAYYKELRRNVEQIQKSQKIMMKDIAKTKEKERTIIGNYAGTGFLISSNGYVATSYHLVKEADSVYIENEKYGTLRAVVVHSYPDNDISILRIDQSAEFPHSSLPFVLSKNEASLAEEVYTLGFPREDVVFGEGSVSALSGYRQNPNAYQVSVPVNPGNSGGPLLNSKGDLIGMISGFQTETSGAAFAIKSTVILDAIKESSLDTLETPLLLPRQNNLKGISRVQQVKRWKDFVFMVRVYKNQ